MTPVPLIEWLRGLKIHTEICGKIFRLSFPLFPIWFVALWGMVRIGSFEKINWWGIVSICSVFPHPYHLSSFKNRPVFDFLVWWGSSMSFSFRFRHHLSNRETAEVDSFLSSLEECLGRGRDVSVWSPNPIGGFFSQVLWLVAVGPLSY